MPLPLAVSCFSKIQIGFTFLVPAHPGSPGQRAIKRVCVYCVYTDIAAWSAAVHGTPWSGPVADTRHVRSYRHLQFCRSVHLRSHWSQDDADPADWCAYKKRTAKVRVDSNGVYLYLLVMLLWWLGSRVVSMLDSCAEGFWVQIAVATLSGNSLRQTVHTHLFTKQQNW